MEADENMSVGLHRIAGLAIAALMVATYSCKGKERWIVSIDSSSGYCPVCNMRVSASGDSTSEIRYADSTKIMFESPADLLMYYFAPERFQTEKNTEITQITFRDYNSKKHLDATAVALVIESRVKGPMGSDVFAFENAKDADAFVASNGGVVTRFSGMTKESVQNLRP